MSNHIDTKLHDVLTIVDIEVNVNVISSAKA